MPIKASVARGATHVKGVSENFVALSFFFLRAEVSSRNDRCPKHADGRFEPRRYGNPVLDGKEALVERLGFGVDILEEFRFRIDEEYKIFSRVILDDDRILADVQRGNLSADFLDLRKLGGKERRLEVLRLRNEKEHRANAE